MNFENLFWFLFSADWKIEDRLLGCMSDLDIDFTEEDSSRYLTNDEYLRVLAEFSSRYEDIAEL